MHTARASIVGGLVAWFATVGASVLAQQQSASERGRYAGWVPDAAGKRLVGADVTLLSRPLPARPDLGVADELHVRTGDDGMFRVELLHGRAYSAWATFRDDSGVVQRTQVVEGVVPGPPRAIEPIAAQKLNTVRITGAERWRDQAPFTATVFSSSENVGVYLLQLEADMTAAMPTLPGDWCEIEVRGKNGMMIALFPSVQLDEGPEQSFALPEPVSVTFRVVDENGKPLAGAMVRHNMGYHRRDIGFVLGETGADGELVAAISSQNPMYRSENTSCQLVVEKVGRRRTAAWTQIPKEAPRVIEVTLPPGTPLNGQVLAADGGPVEGLVLLPDCYATGADADTSGTGVALHSARYDHDGRFAFTSLHTHYDFRLLALLDPALARRQGLRLRPGIAVAPVIWLATGAPPFANPHELDKLRLDQIEVAQIEVQTDAGGRCRGRGCR